jgi:beta-barrel assembly-enhancing protease
MMSQTYLVAVRRDFSTRILWFMLCLLALLVSASAQSRGDAFQFGEVDLEFLDQIKQLDKKFDDQGLVFQDPASNAWLEKLGRSMLGPEDELENVVWRFRILRDSSLNAFALPNGSIYMHAGLLARLETEPQAAAVLAHEIIHVRNRHSYLGYRSYRKKMLTVNLLSIAGAYGGGIGLGASLAAQFMLSLSIVGHSRDLEKEADLEGLKRITQTPYGSQPMVDALECFMNSYEVELRGEPFYGDHPKTKDRIAYLQEAVSKHTQPGNGSSVPAAKEYYQKIIASVTRHDIKLAIDDGLYRTAVRLGKRLTEFAPDAANKVALADSYAALGPRPLDPSAEETTRQGKREAKKRRNKLTSQEEDRALAATPAGGELQKANYKEAEKLYLQAVELEPKNAMAWRGLGELYEKQSRHQNSIDAYRKYVEFQPAAMDRLMIMRRIKAMEAKSTPAAPQER